MDNTHNFGVAAPPGDNNNSDEDVMSREEFFRFYRQHRQQRLEREAALQNGTYVHTPERGPEPMPMLYNNNNDDMENNNVNNNNNNNNNVWRANREVQALFWTAVKYAFLSVILSRGVNWRCFVLFAVFAGAKLVRHIASKVHVVNPDRLRQQQQERDDEDEEQQRPRGPRPGEVKGVALVVRLATLFVFSAFPSWRLELLEA
eukprot:PhM_4_TR5058/c0_g1_i1/m.64687